MIRRENNPAPGPANTEESGIGGTSVVGIFSDGRAGCGAEDMAGNVWEWCATAYRDYPLPDDLGPETLDTLSGIVLRGGSWDYKRSNARCGVRFDFSPSYAYFGFRVARLFSSPSGGEGETRGWDDVD
jgi:formylglycine-generating enzyme required for sulfatase activity